MNFINVPAEPLSKTNKNLSKHSDANSAPTKKCPDKSNDKLKNAESTYQLPGMINSNVRYVHYEEKTYLQIKLNQDKLAKQKEQQLFEKTIKLKSSLNESPENIKKKIKNEQEQTQKEKNHYKLDRVYKYYCRLGGKYTSDCLTLTNFHNFLFDSGAFEKSKISKMDLYFFKDNKSKNSIDFNGFLGVLTEVSICKFNKENSPTISAKDCTKNFFNTYILPLYNKLFEEGLKPKIESKIMRKSCLQDVPEVSISECDEAIYLLREVAPVLLEIYFIYFPWEATFADNISFVKNKSGKAFYNLAVDFNLSPLLISQTSTFLIFESEAIKEENYGALIHSIFGKERLKKILHNGLNSMGIYFNFGKFLHSLAKIADSSPDVKLYSKIGEDANNYKPFTLDRINIILTVINRKADFHFRENRDFFKIRYFNDQLDKRKIRQVIAKRCL